MANTNSLSKIVEPFILNKIREELHCDFEPVHTSLKLLTGGEHRFDIVSRDRSIVGDIKSNSVRQNGKVGSGVIKSIYYDIYLLTLVEAKKKMMILTNPNFYKVFSKHSAGKIPFGIDLRLIELPFDLEELVEKDRKLARNEIGKRK